MGKKILFITIALFTFISAQNIKLDKEFTLDYEFVNPTDIDVDKDGNIYVFENDSQEILIFNSNGKFKTKIGHEGNGPGEFNHASLFEFDNQENIWIYNSGNRRFDVINKEGDFIRSVTLPVHEKSFDFSCSAFKICSKNIIHIAYRDLWSSFFLYMKCDSNGKILEQKHYTERPTWEESKINHPEMSFDNMVTLNTQNQVYYGIVDELILHTSSEQKINLPFEKSAYTNKERELILNKMIESFSKGYMAGASSAGKTNIKIPKDKLPKDTFKYRPYYSAVVSVNDKLLTFSPLEEKSKVSISVFEKNKYQFSSKVKLDFAKNIRNITQESIFSDGKNLFYIQKDKDEFPQVIKYKVAFD